MSSRRWKAEIQHALSVGYASQSAYIPSLESYIEIRPLTAAQWNQVQTGATERARWFRRAAKNDFKADILTCHLGLVEEWTEEELGELPAVILKDISEAIQIISSVKQKDPGPVLTLIEGGE